MDFKKIKKTFFANCTWGFVSEFRPSQFTTINDLTHMAIPHSRSIVQIRHSSDRETPRPL